jgi:hypothetical protein
MGTKEIHTDDNFVRDEYGEIIRRKKDVSVLSCLFCLMKETSLSDLGHTDLIELFNKPGDVVISGEIKREIFSDYLMDYVIPKVADECIEVKQALIPRDGVRMNDIEIAYYSSDGFPENFDRALFFVQFSIDIVLRNHRIPIERRKEIANIFERIAVSPNEHIENSAQTS